MNAAEIKRMTAVERLRAIESLWDALLLDQVEIPSPQWHEAILAERREKILNGTAKFLTMEELKAKRIP